MNNIVSDVYSTTKNIHLRESNYDGVFEAVLVLPDSETRVGEGGLRKMGLFKQSYECKPLITIVTVVFNGEKFLEETILSVIGQSYDNVEYIIIDGGSTDGTLDIIRKYEHAIDYWVSEEDKGIYNAMNKGIDLASGEWINFMNADDYFASEDVINIVAENIRNVSYGCSIVYGELYLIDDNGLCLSAVSTSSEDAKRKIKYKLSIPHQSQFSRLSFIKEIGKFKENYKISADYEMTIRLLKNNDCFFVENLIVAKMRVGGISSDPVSSLMILKEYRQAQIDNQIGLTFYFLILSLRVYVRIAIWSLFGEKFARKALDMGNKLLRRNTFWVKPRK